MRLSHATAKNKSGLSVTSTGTQGITIGGTSRGASPLPPPPLSATSQGGFLQLQGEYGAAAASSPLHQQSFNNIQASTPGAYTNNIAQPQPQQGQQAPPLPPPSASTTSTLSDLVPLPPPERRLSPNMIEYLTQYMAANGGRLPFGPATGLSFPPQQSGQGGLATASPTAIDGPSTPSGGQQGSTIVPAQQQHQQQQQQQLLGQSFNSSSLPVSPGSASFPTSPGASLFPGTLSLGGVQQQPQQQPQQPPLSRNDSAGISPLSPSATAPLPPMYDTGNNNGAVAGQVPSPVPGSTPVAGAGGGGGGTVNSTDPNNTTVFVGGLSSLISEETLKTFFAPFGEITYVR